MSIWSNRQYCDDGPYCIVRMAVLRIWSMPSSNLFEKILIYLISLWFLIFSIPNQTNISHVDLGLTREIANLTGRTDSENDNAEITPDTDTDSQEHLQKIPHVSSFKRPAPVMGNRGLETRNSKRSQYHPQLQAHKKESPPPITVGALEEQNVKRAINRYGTLPKGARIGAFLDSLQQSDGTVTVATAAQKNGALIELPPPLPQQSQTLNNHSKGGASSSMSPRAVAKAQPQMIRSNSSGGVTMTNSATSSLNKLQRHRTAADGTMIFSSFRGTSGSPKRSFNPALADLEFPPPPLDLPPPPEEFENPHDEELCRGNIDPMQMSVSLTPSNDVSNTEPSVEEASSRFGVSLRKREPSTDSCSSLGSPAGATSGADYVIDAPLATNTNSLNAKDKLDMKMVAEIKERAEQQQRKLSSDVPNNNISNKTVDHVSQLVNELAETMNLPKKNSVAQLPPKPDATNNFKAQLKKVEPKKTATAPITKEEIGTIIDFKSRLRRVENNNENDSTDVESKRGADMEDKPLPTDIRFKSPLKEARDRESVRVENDKKLGKPITKKNGDSRSILSQQDNVNNRKKSVTESNPKVIDMKKTDNKIDSQDEKKKRESNDANKATSAEEEDKRKSTGSISSLKKLWESKEVSGTPANDQSGTQTSPKMGSKGVISNNNKNGDEENDDHSMTNKKPAVPLKPTKLVSIYATPIPMKLPDLAGSKVDAPSVGNGTANNANNTSPNTAQISREGILDLVHLLEGSLKLPINSISASQWLQLSDKLNILQYSCVVFADKETMPPHSKFHFRELVTRVETQSRCLRSAGSKNISDNEKLVTEVGQSLKQISNALHR